MRRQSHFPGGAFSKKLIDIRNLFGYNIRECRSEADKSGVVLVSTGVLKLEKPFVDQIHAKSWKLNINANEESYAYAA